MSTLINQKHKVKKAVHFFISWHGHMDQPMANYWDRNAVALLWRLKFLLQQKAVRLSLQMTNKPTDASHVCAHTRVLVTKPPLCSRLSLENSPWLSCTYALYKIKIYSTMSEKIRNKCGAYNQRSMCARRVSREADILCGLRKKTKICLVKSLILTHQNLSFLYRP